MNLEINLKPVAAVDCSFLYTLLKNRDSKINISHKTMPPYSKHVRFVKSKPYAHWYIIMSGKYKIGSIYLTRNDEIGIFIRGGFQSKGYGIKALKALMKKHPKQQYLANISPKNLHSIRFFKRHGFKPVQLILQYTLNP